MPFYLCRNPSVVITIEDKYEGTSIEEWAKSAIGTIVYTGWPFLVESKVVSVSDALFKYELQVNRGRRDVVKTPHSDGALTKFQKTAERIESHYSKRFATLIGPVEAVVEVLPVRGA